MAFLITHRTGPKDSFMCFLFGPQRSLVHILSRGLILYYFILLCYIILYYITVYILSVYFLQEGSQVSSSLVALQAERDALLRSTREKDGELSSLRQQAQQQQGSLDLERDRLLRELEALRAQLQQQVQTHRAL